MKSRQNICVGLLLGGILISGCRKPEIESVAPEKPENPAEAVEEKSKEEVAEINSLESVSAETVESQSEATTAEDFPGDDSSSGDNSSTGSGSSSGSPSTSRGIPAGSNRPELPAPKFKTPQSAFRFASQKKSDSATHAESGNAVSAYNDALEGWQALRPHRSDPKCKTLSRKLMTIIEQHGEKLGSHGPSIVGKPLKIK